MTTRYAITPQPTGLRIELTGVGEREVPLLDAFGECQAGRCTCQTDEYEKVESMAISTGTDSIEIELTAKPGTAFDPVQIAECLDYTVEAKHR